MPSISDIERKQLLLPVVASAVAAGATFAVRKLPGVVNGSLMPALKDKIEGEAEEMKEQVEDSGGALGLAAKAADKLSGSSSRGKGTGEGRRLPIQVSVDVAAPVSFAFEQWTDFKKLGKFLHRVESVEQKGDNKVIWHENIWGRRRTWRAEITEKRANQLLAWKDEHGVGVLSFHPLAPRLTRIELSYDWMPHGLLEKMASGMRFHKRAARTDLQRFKAHTETQHAKHRHSNAGQNSSKPARSRARSNGKRQTQRA